jgi:hypothetical protein
MKNIKVFEDYTSAQTNEGHDHKNNYMFFQHLHTIKDAIEDIMKMDSEKVDAMLSNGHNWALDHMATSVDDIEEVYHFLKNRMHGEEMMATSEPIEMTQVEIVDEPGAEEDDENEGEED